MKQVGYVSVTNKVGMGSEDSLYNSFHFYAHLSFFVIKKFKIHLEHETNWIQKASWGNLGLPPSRTPTTLPSEVETLNLWIAFG